MCVNNERFGIEDVVGFFMIHLNGHLANVLADSRVSGPVKPGTGLSAPLVIFIWSGTLGGLRMAKADPTTTPSAPRTKKRKQPPKNADGAKRKLWTFPKNTLEDAIQIAKAIEEKNAGNPMPAQDLAIGVG